MESGMFLLKKITKKWLLSWTLIEMAIELCSNKNGC